MLTGPGNSLGKNIKLHEMKYNNKEIWRLIFQKNSIIILIVCSVKRDFSKADDFTE